MTASGENSSILLTNKRAESVEQKRRNSPEKKSAPVKKTPVKKAPMKKSQANKSAPEAQSNKGRAKALSDSPAEDLNQINYPLHPRRIWPD